MYSSDKFLEALNNEKSGYEAQLVTLENRVTNEGLSTNSAYYVKEKTRIETLINEIEELIEITRNRTQPGLSSVSLIARLRDQQIKTIESKISKSGAKQKRIERLKKKLGKLQAKQQRYVNSKCKWVCNRINTDSKIISEGNKTNTIMEEAQERINNRCNRVQDYKERLDNYRSISAISFLDDKPLLPIVNTSLAAGYTAISYVENLCLQAKLSFLKLKVGIIDAQNRKIERKNANRQRKLVVR